MITCSATLSESSFIADHRTTSQTLDEVKARFRSGRQGLFGPFFAVPQCARLDTDGPLLIASLEDPTLRSAAWQGKLTEKPVLVLNQRLLVGDNIRGSGDDAVVNGS